MSKETKTIQVSIRLTPEDIELLDKYCQQFDFKRAYVIRTALREYLKNFNERIEG